MLPSAQPSVADRSQDQIMPAQDARPSLHGEKWASKPRQLAQHLSAPLPGAQPSTNWAGTLTMTCQAVQKMRSVLALR